MRMNLVNALRGAIAEGTDLQEAFNEHYKAITLRYRFSGYPVSKERPRFNQKTGKVFTPATTRKYESMVRREVRNYMVYRGLSPLVGSVAVHLAISDNIYPDWSDAKQELAAHKLFHTQDDGDIDNKAKAILDALNGVAYRDDKQIQSMTLSRNFNVAGPGFDLTVSTVKMLTKAEYTMLESLLK